MDKVKVVKAIIVGVFVPVIAIGVYYGGKWAINKYKKSRGVDNDSKDESLEDNVEQTKVEQTKSVSKNPFSTKSGLEDFQKYANKNGFSLVVDGVWGKNSSTAYSKIGESYAKNKIAVGDNKIINTLVTTIYNAKGGAWYKNDDEEAVFSSIRALGTKYNWNTLSIAFQKKYNVKVLDYLKTFLESTEMFTVNNMIKKLK